MIDWIRKKRIILILIGLVILILLFAKSCGASESASGVEAAGREVLSPAGRVANFLGNFFDFSTKKALQAQIDELELQLAEKEALLQIAEEVETENERLKSLLNFTESYANQWEMVAAKVIGRDINNWYESVLIDKGANDGLANGMAVVDQDGLVGRITNVTNNTAEVLLIVDQMGSLGAMLQSSRSQGVLEGIGGGKGLLKLQNLPYDADVQLNEVVVTSGVGGVFPGGIQVGTVVKINNALDGLSQEAIVEPFCDFDRLEEVLVLKGQVEATTDETTDETTNETTDEGEETEE